MAFQVGTRVRPELGAIDYSGFTRAAEMQAQTLANLGAAIGEGIQEYQKNKTITAAALAGLEGVTAANPDVVGAAQQAGGDVSKAFKAIQSGDYKQRDVLTAKGFADSFQEQKIEQQEADLRSAQIAKTLAGLQPTEPFEPRQKEFDGTRFVEVEPGKFTQVKEAPLPKESEAEAEINRILAANPNLSMMDAVNIKEGLVKVVVDPITKRAFKVNLAENTQEEIGRTPVTDTAVTAALAPEDDEPSSVNLYKIAESTTGFFPALTAAAQRVTGGVLGVDVADPQLLRDLQTFQTAQSDIRRSLRTAPKFLASEMDMLSKEIDIAPGAFKDPLTLKSQLESIDTSLRTRLKDLSEKIKNPNLPADEVSGALRLRTDLINFLRILGVPQDTETTKETESEISDIASKYLNLK